MELHESFLRHRHWRDLKAAAATCVVALALYAWHDPLDGPNGGTWLGYALGTLGALIIVVLSWLGLRKRKYASNAGTVKGWVSAHVYFGLALVIIATLHTGFHFGVDIHTLAYLLMLLVIASGVFGVVVYSRYPRLITDLRAQGTRDGWIEDVLDLNERAIQLADQIGPDVHRFVLRSTERLRIGGTWREQLLAPPEGKAPELTAIAEILRKKLGASQLERSDESEGLILFSTQQIMISERDPNVDRLKHLLELLTRRNELAARINRDVQMHARMQVWLYVHVPLTAMLLAALTAHIVSVFLYR